jgi:type I restriction enzyme, S subunit
VSRRSVPTVTVAEVARTFAGGTPPRGESRFFGGDIPWVKSGEVARSPITCTEETLTVEGLAASAAKWCEAGSTLIAMYGATAGTVGRLAIGATTNQAVLCVEARDKEDEAFLYHALRAAAPTLLGRTQGSGQPNLNAGIISRLRLPWPERPVRKQVCRVLDVCDMLVAHSADVVAAKRALKRGLMQELLAGKRRFSRFAGEWGCVPLGHFFTEKGERNRDESVATVLSCSKVHGIIPQTQRFAKRLASKRIAHYKVVAANDLVYDPMLLWDASLGIVGGVEEGVVSPAYATFTFNSAKGDLRFLRQALFTHEVRHSYRTISRGTNARRKKAMPADFLRIRIPVPPTQEEQERLGVFFEMIDREIALSEALRQRYRQMRQVVMQRLVSGELPVLAQAEHGYA